MTFYNSDPFASDLEAVLEEVKTMLLTKNAAYGDSALNPMKVFSKLNARERMCVRIDDKFSRLFRGDDFAKEVITEDTINDLIGYLVLMKIAERRGL